MPSNHLGLCHFLPYCLQPFPASGSFPKSKLFASGGQSIGASASASVFPVNIQGWFPLGLTGLISVEFKGLERVFFNITVWKHLALSFFMVQCSHPDMTTGKTIALTEWTFVGKAMSLLSNMLSRLAIAFLPRVKRLNLMAAVTIHCVFGVQKNKVCHYFHFSPINMSWSDGAKCHDLSSLYAEF